MRFNWMLLVIASAIVIGAGLFVIMENSDESEAITEGQCGAELYWKYDDSTKTLEITGTGAMYNYTNSLQPWASYRSSMTTLSLPNSLTHIGSGAFKGCSNLTGNLTIPSSVASIGERAFEGCSGFTGTLTIPSSVTSIGSFAFRDCSRFTSTIEIPSSVTTIGNAAFCACGVAGFLVNMGNTNYKSIEGVLLNKSGTELMACPIGKTGTLKIPSSVTSIGLGAFKGCSNLTGNLTIPSSVTSIGGSAFYGCSGFTGSLTIPNSVTSIGNYAFRDCSGFTGSLTIPNSVTSIGEGAFYWCSGFTGSLTIGNSVTSIGNHTFSWCSGFIGSLTIPSSVTSIGDRAFQSCSGFTGSLTIPSSVTSIGDSAFYRCSGLTGNLTIPNSVTSIGDSAFYRCSKLTGSLTIPDSVMSISDYAFYGCSGFTSITIPSSIKNIGSYAFYDINFYAEDGTTALQPTVDDLAGYYFAGTYSKMVRGGTPPSPQQYAVTVVASPSAGGTVTGGGTYTSGSTTTITATANSGYQFVKWNDNTTNASRSITVNSNITYTATFVKLCTVTVTASPSSGGTVTGGGTYSSGSTINISATANSGYQFVKWNDNTTNASRSATVSSNITYTATFAKLYTVTVVASPSAGGTVTGGGTYTSGTTTTITATANSGYQFVKWNDNNTNASRSVIVTSNITYTATFAKLYILTVVASTGGTVTGDGTYASGSTVNISANANSGYQFVKWNDNNTNASRSVTVNSDVTYTATFKDVTGKTVTLIASPAEGGTVSGGGTYVPDSSAILTATPNAGYRFVKWNDNNTNATRTIVVTSDITYTATFEQIQHKVTVIASPVAGGTVTGSGTYDFGSSVTISATANNGYQFVKWNDNNTTASRSVTVNSDITYTATFVRMYNVNVVASPSSGGTVTGGGTYSSGSAINISATANSGYQFVKWNDDNTNASRPITVNSDVTYTATFVKLYTLTVVASTGGTVSGGGTYVPDSSATLIATPNTGYEFVKWNDNNTNATRTIVVTSDVTYTATFELLPVCRITSSAVNGTITETQDVDSGSDFTVSYRADDGYSLKYIIVDGTNVNISYYPNSYTFHNVTESHSISAVYGTEEEYTVQFRNWNGSLISSAQYSKNESIIIPESPSRDSDDDYSYKFSRWSPSVPEKCVSDATYIAQYDRTAIDNDNDDSNGILIIALAVAVVVFAALVAVAVFVMRKN